MNTLLTTIFNTSKYDTRTGKFRANVIYVLLVFIAIFWLFNAVSDARWALPDGGEDVTMIENAFQHPFEFAGLMFFGVWILASITFFTNYQGFGNLAGWSLTAMWFVSGVMLQLEIASIPGEASGAILALFILAGFLIGGEGLIVTSIASFVVLMIARDSASSEVTTSLFVVIARLMAGVFLVYLFMRFTRTHRIQGASDAAEDRALTSDILSQIAHRVSERASLATLFNDIVSQINQKIDAVYHTQIFLVDDSTQTANLVASTGEVGKKLMEFSHGLGVGTQSVVGQVTGTGEPLIAIAGVRGTIHRPNPLLPETAVEATFPLRVGQKVIGALDLQSKRATAFNDPNLVSSLQALADSTALAIDNVSQFEQAQKQLAENEQLVKRTQEALREVERLNEHLTGLAWSEYLQGDRGRLGFNMDFIDDEMEPEESNWTPALREALEVNSFVQENRNERQVIAVPLRVRGQVIGAMEFELDENQSLTPEDLEMLQEVSERFGMATENARLVDESQRVAQREALVNQISSRLQTTNNVENTLAEAARSLKEVLKAESITIRLGLPPADLAGK